MNMGLMRSGRMSVAWCGSWARPRLACITLILAGCGGVEGQFLDALNTEEETRATVRPGDVGVSFWIQNDGEGHYISFKQDSTKNRLLDLGCISTRTIQVRRWGAGFGSRAQQPAFELTEDGKEFMEPGKRILVGTRSATEIVEYTDPPVDGAVQATFRYEVEINEVGEALAAEDHVAEEGEGSAIFQKTNNGWRLLDASW